LTIENEIQNQLSRETERQIVICRDIAKSVFVGAMDMDWKDREKSQDQDS
jgi:hypothetical protein